MKQIADATAIGQCVITEQEAQMKSSFGINTRWILLADAIGKDIKNKFNAYSWYTDSNIKASKSEHWCGWWNDCFDFVTLWPLSAYGVGVVKKAAQIFEQNGYTVRPAISGGISISYETMTAEESHQKAYDNLMNGGRMSD